jgi:hypothetical protein
MDSKEAVWFVSILAAVCIFIAYIIPKAQKVEMEQQRIGDTIVNTSAAYTPFEKKKINENFTNMNEYVEQGQARYNPLGDTQTVQTNNLVVPPSDPTGARTNQSIVNATATVMFEPGDSSNGTNVSGNIDESVAKVPGRNKVAEAAKRCEAKSGRSCELLDDSGFSNECGICLKDGTRALDEKEGQWIGGLHVSKDDIRNAKESGIAVQPTAGACPPGYFFVERSKCEEMANRLDCEEAGEAGGWLGTKASVVEQKCAQCAPGETFVYDPKNRSFNFAIRAISPSGTGKTIIKLFLLNNDGSRNKQIGGGEISGIGTKGNEVRIVSNSEVKEGERIEIEVVQEFSTHTVGQPEVYAVDRGRYALTKDSARMLCESLDGRLATPGELAEAHSAGADWCYSAHLSEGNPSYPIQVERPGCGIKAVNSYGSPSDLRGATCYGIKPSVSDDYSATNNIVLPFSQEPAYAESRFGKTNKGVRAILLQLEDSNNSNIKIGIEKYLESAPKRLGMFSSSGIIKKPKATDYSSMLKDNYWMWYGSGQINKFIFKIPGTFLPTFLKEDQTKCMNKYLITKKDSIVGELKTACSEGKPGSYSGQCLANLFAASGGDIAKGKLSPTIGGADAINELLKDGLKNRTEDEISEYCFNLYTIATTGKNLKNEVMSKEMINSAADKMFGFIIASPCEDIEVSNTGTVGLRAKSKPLPIECLNHLYKNAGSEMSKGFEEEGRRSVISATYSTIGDRFSGLRKNEYGVSSERKAANPFKTCTDAGTIAPVSKSGINNSAIQKINSVSDGSVEGVQTLFDRIFQQANKDGGIMDGIGSTLEACFGIFKAPGPSSSELDYDNLMKTLYEPRKISFKLFNRDAGLRHAGFLLMASGSSKDDLYKKDSTFRIVKALNGKDNFVSFESINFPGFYLRHAGFRVYLNPNDRSTLFANDASFKIVKGLNNDSKTISLQSSNYPDRHIMLDSSNNNSVWLVPINRTDNNMTNNASFIITCPNTTEELKYVKLYQHCDYNGYEVLVKQGRYNMRTLIAMGMRNDDISSIRCFNGAKITIYEHDNFGGRSLTFNRDVRCLVDFGFNDSLSSVIVE